MVVRRVLAVTAALSKFCAITLRMIGDALTTSYGAYPQHFRADRPAIFLKAIA